MNLFINPGSGSLATSDRWDNTLEQATKNVMDWFFQPMLDEGYQDLTLINLDKQDEDGRWCFEIRHNITGVTVPIETHGITDLKEYEAENIWTPRVYYNGGSSTSPSLEDFKAEGFSPVMSYRANASPTESKHNLDSNGDTK